LQSKLFPLTGLAIAALVSASIRPGAAQITSATFGSVITLGGTPSDIVLDEARGYLYLVESSKNQVVVYDYNAQAVIRNITVGKTPLSAAMSMDGSLLYVTNNGSSSLSVVDLKGLGVMQTVTLPAKPQGVEVGADGRAVIATQGTGTGNLLNTLLIFDRTQPLSQQVLPVDFPPAPSAPSGVPAPGTRPVTTFNSKLLRTPDGNLIIGVNVNGNATTLYAYEPNSGTVLRSRAVSGQSSVLAMSPDGGRFMAGFTLYDTATLAVIAQQNTANAPFPITGAFNTMQNIGGSTFSPDGATIYSAFNVAPFVQPATRPQASTLLISDARHLFIKLGIKLPESVVAKMVMTSDGGNAWGLSESGVIYLPLSALYNYPIIAPETTTVFLANDDCNRGVATMPLKISNIGGGKLTFSVPDTGSAVLAQATSGVAPAAINFTMDPGRNGVIRQPGTNLFTGGATATGSAVQVNIRSVDAINIPPTIRIYMNYRQSEQKGVIYPIPTVPNSTVQGLQDMVLDTKRNLLYISNAGYNRVEVFDTQQRVFLTPIDVGQLPHQMALSLDGDTLYVANTGAESISIVDLTVNKVMGGVQFPPYPRAGNSTPISVSTLAMGLSGLQFIRADGTQWETIGNQAVLRQPDSVAVNPNNSASNVLPGPALLMMATPGGENILTLNNLGTVYLYDALSDSYTASRQLFNAQVAPITGYYGPLAASPVGGYFLVNGVVLSPAITQNILDAGARNVAAVAPIDTNTFLRITTPVRNAINSTTTDDPRTLLETFDLQGGGESLVGPLAENPQFEVFGTARQAMPPRQMVVDANGTVYAITLSGLTVLPLPPSGGASPKPQIASTRPIVNSSDGTANFKPGAFITINGTNLADPAVATQLPPPTVLGGSCVVFDDMPIPLLQTSSGNISAQLPANVHAGVNVMQVRSLSGAQQSDPIVVLVQKP
jgi:YVTN family beta-propeller protein